MLQFLCYSQRRSDFLPSGAAAKIPNPLHTRCILGYEYGSLVSGGDGARLCQWRWGTVTIQIQVQDAVCLKQFLWSSLTCSCLRSSYLQFNYV